MEQEYNLQMRDVSTKIKNVKQAMPEITMKTLWSKNAICQRISFLKILT